MIIIQKEIDIFLVFKGIRYKNICNFITGNLEDRDVVKIFFV